eukprot:4677981-Pyramimonas_sp.AAC.2
MCIRDRVSVSPLRAPTVVRGVPILACGHGGNLPSAAFGRRRYGTRRRGLGLEGLKGKWGEGREDAKGEKKGRG